MPATFMPSSIWSPNKAFGTAIIKAGSDSPKASSGSSLRWILSPTFFPTKAFSMAGSVSLWPMRIKLPSSSVSSSKSLPAVVTFIFTFTTLSTVTTVSSFVFFAMLFLSLSISSYYSSFFSLDVRNTINGRKKTGLIGNRSPVFQLQKLLSNLFLKEIKNS